MGCAHCYYLNSVTSMRCEVCDNVWQAEAPCGSAEPSVQQPSKLPEPWTVSFQAPGRRPPNDEKVKEDDSLAWEVSASVANVVVTGVVGLAGMTAQSVQDGWNSALTALFSPFVGRASRPDGPQAEWLCGGCGRTLKGPHANFCAYCNT